MQVQSPGKSVGSEGKSLKSVCFEGYDLFVL